MHKYGFLRFKLCGELLSLHYVEGMRQKGELTNCFLEGLDVVMGVLLCAALLSNGVAGIGCSLMRIVYCGVGIWIKE